MATKVNCTVNTCTYWGEGNECAAQNILVQSDQGQGMVQQVMSTIGMSASTMSNTPACESKETQCRTFKEK